MNSDESQARMSWLGVFSQWISSRLQGGADKRSERWGSSISGRGGVVDELIHDSVEDGRALPGVSRSTIGIISQG